MYNRRSQSKITQEQKRKASICSKFKSKSKSEISKAVDDIVETQKIIKKDSEEKRVSNYGIEMVWTEKRKSICDERSEIIKKIPHFWKTAVLNHPKLNYLLNDFDRLIFADVSSIMVGKHQGGKNGYSISFEFCRSGYVQSKKISKNYAVYKRKIVVNVSEKVQWARGVSSENREDSFFSWWFNKENELILKEGDEDQIGDVIIYEFWDNPGQYYYNWQADGDQAGSSAQ